MSARTSRFLGETTIISVASYPDGLLKNGRRHVDITWGGELRYGENVHDSRAVASGKNRLFIIRWNRERRFDFLSPSPSIDRVRATLIFDKCHVGCHRVTSVSLRCVEGTIDFGKGTIRNCQLRRLLHDETSSAINFRSERWSFHEGFWYKSVSLFFPSHDIAVVATRVWCSFGYQSSDSRVLIFYPE